MESVIPLYKLGLGPIDAEDLRWFFCEAEGLILRSGFGAALDRAELNIPRSASAAPDMSITDRLLDLMSRHRKIAKRLTACGGNATRILGRYYGPQPRMLGAFRQYAGLAYSTQAAKRAAEPGVRGKAVLMACLMGLSARFLAKTCAEDDREIVAAIRAESESLYLAACVAYRRACAAKEAA